MAAGKYLGESMSCCLDRSKERVYISNVCVADDRSEERSLPPGHYAMSAESIHDGRAHVRPSDRLEFSRGKWDEDED